MSTFLSSSAGDSTQHTQTANTAKIPQAWTGSTAVPTRIAHLNPRTRFGSYSFGHVSDLFEVVPHHGGTLFFLLVGVHSAPLERHPSRRQPIRGHSGEAGGRGNGWLRRNAQHEERGN